MDSHSRKMEMAAEISDEESLPLAELEDEQKHHESLKNIFSKHGVDIEYHFLRDLKEWKLS